MGLFSIVTPSFSMDSAETIYEKSVKIFTHKNIAVVIESTIKYQKGHSENRTFFLAKKKFNDGNESILIRFLEPDDIKCTAVLINREGDEVRRYAYFPALKRVRIIPDSDRSKEVFGIGISYEDLGLPKGQFKSPKTVNIEGVLFYQLTLVSDSKTTQYTIDSNSYQLKNMQVFKNGVLEKSITINEVKDYFGEDLIMSWDIHYPATNRTIYSVIRPESIREELKDSLFHKNKIKRCKF